MKLPLSIGLKQRKIISKKKGAGDGDGKRIRLWIEEASKVRNG
jgi:hypothetical protein